MTGLGGSGWRLLAVVIQEAVRGLSPPDEPGPRRVKVLQILGPAALNEHVLLEQRGCRGLVIVISLWDSLKHARPGLASRGADQTEITHVNIEKEEKASVRDLRYEDVTGNLKTSQTSARPRERLRFFRPLLPCFSSAKISTTSWGIRSPNPMESRFDIPTHSGATP
ncbi:hypothetical protein EYF80_002336 [Liparis tanakae]|uniref:Uncharacterized protein n=1 Tax=Liparis tanakae TaxID=230148 RepID=A0A4Z2JBB4_9TELE|nr:hypothetical protein EYF80_002336 [Liparis tanakae]